LKSFDALVAGQTYWLPMNERLAHLIVNCYLQLMFDPGADMGGD